MSDESPLDIDTDSPIDELDPPFLVEDDTLGDAANTCCTNEISGC